MTKREAVRARDLYDLSKEKPEEWAQKEREVEKMHQDIESYLTWAIYLNPYEFFLNIREVAKDWKSRGGLMTAPQGCADCKAPSSVVVLPL